MRQLSFETVIIKTRWRWIIFFIFIPWPFLPSASSVLKSGPGSTGFAQFLWATQSAPGCWLQAALSFTRTPRKPESGSWFARGTFPAPRPAWNGTLRVPHTSDFAVWGLCSGVSPGSSTPWPHFQTMTFPAAPYWSFLQFQLPAFFWLLRNSLSFI